MAGQPSLSPPPARRANIAWIVFAAVAAFYLLTEHRAHLLGLLPYALLLACPLMHFFMHHGHHHRFHPSNAPPPGAGGDDRASRQ